MGENQKKVPAKRVDIVQVKLVREKTMLYKNRRIRSPHDAYELMKEFLGDVDREHFIVLCMDTKNQPTCIQTVHIGSLNSSIVHPREVLKPAILSNSCSWIHGDGSRGSSGKKLCKRVISAKLSFVFS